MKAQFLSDGSDFRARGGGGSLAKNRRDEGLFWWTILITLLIGVMVCCWFFSIMVFRYPEKPFNYRLLTKLEKLEPIAKFDPLAAGATRLPNGTFHSARDLLNRYYNYNPEQMRLTNSVLKRAYIMNYYGETPVYVKGTYSVTLVRPLAEGDLMTHGWVVRARSVDLEDVEIELLLPRKAPEAGKVAAANQAVTPYQVGEKLALENKTSFCSVIHVLRNQDADGLCATVVPISYGEFNLGNQKTLALAPPASLNVEAPLPITGAVVPAPAGANVAAQGN